MNLRNRNFRRWRGLEDVDPTKWSEDGRIFSDEADVFGSWEGNFFKTGWWFQIFFIFTPTWGDDPI